VYIVVTTNASKYHQPTALLASQIILFQSFSPFMDQSSPN